MKTANNLRQLREAKGYTLAHVARQLGVTPGSIRGYERGSTRISARHAAALSRILGGRVVATKHRSQLRAIRESVGMSAEQLARAAMIAPGHLQKLETGARPIPAELARLFSHLLGAPIDATGWEKNESGRRKQA